MRPLFSTSWLPVWIGLLSLPVTSLHAESVPLTAFAADVPIPAISVTIRGQTTATWQTSTQQSSLILKTTASPKPISGALYLEITYLDQGYGRLMVTGRTNDGQSIKPDKFTRVVLSDSGNWVTSYERLNGLPDSGVTEIDVTLGGNHSDHPLAIARAAIQDMPFSDPHFQYIMADAWKAPYAGATTPGIDNTTLKGKVMVGYQGWFRTPNDPADQGWIHWGNMNRGEFTTDMWPDVSAYPPEALDKAGDIKTLSGKTAYLFSSAWPEVVRTHFTWMRRNNIDGAFVQRFLGDMYTSSGRPDYVLDNVRTAANQEGRIWAVEYDVSGAADDKVLAILKKDWAWMIDNFGIRKDPAYAHEGGKLVVFIWGLPFPDRHFSSGTANAVVDFFKNDPIYGGNYVIGGIPSDWRNEDAGWQDHFKKYDGILTWMPHSFSRDAADFKAMGVDYYPHVHPGFSWANLKHLPTGSTEQSTPRDGGRTYERMFARAAESGADRLFVGMFDEYDEGTAIAPMSDDPPPTPSRPGTVVKFFADPKLQEHPETSRRSRVAFTFDGSAPARGIPPQNFLMRWEGQIVPPSDGDYTLKVEGPATDSWSLWINEKQVATKTAGAPATDAVHVAMTANQKVIYRLDYTHASDPGNLKLVWQDPAIPEAEIPESAFVDAWGRFLTNEGSPPDLYLKLTSEAKDMITGHREPTDLSIPVADTH